MLIVVLYQQGAPLLPYLMGEVDEKIISDYNC